ncbi:hypothetical protein ABT113_29500 [Streptomyces mirabilis]
MAPCPTRSPRPTRSSRTTRPRATAPRTARYGGYAYDATSALIQAFKSLHVDPSDTVPSATRESLRAAVQNVDFDGVMGKVGFDANGDAVLQAVTVYRLSGGTWKEAKA